MKEELARRYERVPSDLRSTKRWVGYKIEQREGKSTKVPYNAITGERAQSNNKNTWTSFNVAIKGCEKYGLDGLGFMLGEGIFGVDLDNHPDDNGEYAMTSDEFKSLADEFVGALGSYAEWSMSGKGIHVICKGSLPKGRRRKGCVEMYDSCRFFAFTGNPISNVPLADRTSEIIPLWKKYVDDSEEVAARKAAMPMISADFGRGNSLEDAELVSKAMSANDGGRFARLWSGDMSDYGNDHSSADLALCQSLAFWTNGDRERMDRIFRSSPLMREKWDKMRGADTYGNLTLDKAIANCPQGYSPSPSLVVPAHAPIVKNTEIRKAADKSPFAKTAVMNIDDKGEPIFRPKMTYGHFPYNDTGNAERFYAHFGDCFKYDVKSQCFMFWTGKTWIYDSKSIIRKYANKMIDILKDEINRMEAEASEKAKDEKEAEAEEIRKHIAAAKKNADRISNKAGKDAMLSEFQAIKDIPVEPTDFDKDIYTLNTESGIVDLKTGDIRPFNRLEMLSKNTNCEVSYEEPTQWLKFLAGVFFRGSDPKSIQETKDIINCVQMAMGLTLTGDTREQVMFILYGSGSNGKTTLIEQLSDVMGDYYKPFQSDQLMAKGNQVQQVQFSLANLPGCRCVVSEETNEGDKFAEGTVKALTGSGAINAQQKFGKPFSFIPQFKMWMLTNNLPSIRGTDYGIWRRIFLIPFEHIFTEKEKDPDMPNKLKAERSKILGWCIKGFMKYMEQGGRLKRPDCLKIAVEQYKGEMDVVSRFIDRFCKIGTMGVRVERQEMYRAFTEYARSCNEFELREPKFNKSLILKGYPCEKERDGEQYYRGIELIGSAKSPQSFHSSLFSK